MNTILCPPSPPGKLSLSYSLRDQRPVLRSSYPPDSHTTTAKTRRVIVSNVDDEDDDRRLYSTKHKASNLTMLMAKHEQLADRTSHNNCNEKNTTTTYKNTAITNPKIAMDNNNSNNNCSSDHSSSSLFFASQISSDPSQVTSTSVRLLAQQQHNEAQELQHNSCTTNVQSKMRRCISNNELGGSFEAMLARKAQVEQVTQQRLQIMKKVLDESFAEQSDDSTSTSSRRCCGAEGVNESRNRRKSVHIQQIVQELCEVTAELLLAESKLVTPPHQYGLPLEQLLTGAADNNTTTTTTQQYLLQNIYNFVTALPLRYVLGVETPSEVLLHMRLMAAARSDSTKAAVHILNVQDDDRFYYHYYHHNNNNGNSSSSSSSTATMDDGTINSRTIKHAATKKLRLVTISCRDQTGLLELISRSLATGGSRVLDADVMLTTDGIALDRFVVEMNGRLRLDKLSNLIEEFLREQTLSKDHHDHQHHDHQRTTQQPSFVSGAATETNEPLYVTTETIPSKSRTPDDLLREMNQAVPLKEVLHDTWRAAPKFPSLKKNYSMPDSKIRLQMRRSDDSCDETSPLQQRQQQQIRMQARRIVGLPPPPPAASDVSAAGVAIEYSPGMDSFERGLVRQQHVTVEHHHHHQQQQQRPLINRRATPDLGQYGSGTDLVNAFSNHMNHNNRSAAEPRVIPLISFDELMLIETLGTGRVSTIYRAVWQQQQSSAPRLDSSSVRMVALKVAMMSSAQAWDTAHVDELRSEADIAARLQHPNVCDLVGVASDAECFCLAYEFCEGGSLLSLLSDPRRYYEYLPIALDVANGMAYLHSRNVIHRDLKPSNILLTSDHRAKVSDFGMSVAYSGQELTAETGTYRYMAPEVIRHESYSSNADVYSFGICLWQLITREVPFANLTPVQAAYAVAQGQRPDIPPSVPKRLRKIITACWDQDSHKRPSFTYLAMALADYAKMAFSPANVGAQTLQIANEMLAHVDGNATVNVDYSAPIMPFTPPPPQSSSYPRGYGNQAFDRCESMDSNVGLEI